MEYKINFRKVGSDPSHSQVGTQRRNAIVHENRQGNMDALQDALMDAELPISGIKMHPRQGWMYVQFVGALSEQTARRVVEIVQTIVPEAAIE